MVEMFTYGREQHMLFFALKEVISSVIREWGRGGVKLQQSKEQLSVLKEVSISHMKRPMLNLYL